MRAGNYAAAVGEPTRWPSPKQLYRAAGLNPMQYESAASAATPASVERAASSRALVDLGLGLWLNDDAATQRAVELRARGKKGGVITCAMAHRPTASPSRSSATRSATTRRSGPRRG